MAVNELTSGVGSIDQSRNYLTILMVGLSGAAFLLVFGVNALVAEQYLLATVLIVNASIGVLSALWTWHTGNTLFGRHGISASVILVFIFLMATGGVADTGPLWCYSLLLIVVLLQGFRRGALALLLLLVIATWLMFYPVLPGVYASYSENFKIRFVASFITFGIMALIYEYLRWKSQLNYVAISKELELASSTDMLTGLLNRRALQAALEAEKSQFLRHSYPFSLIMLDLDRFKRINDRYGHATGDELLVRIAQLLKSEVRQQDLVSRWGGEEFLILLPQTNHPQAMVVAEKLRHAIESLDLTGIGVAGSITASFGVQCISGLDPAVDLVSATDRDLYQAKRQGRNRVVGRSFGHVEPDEAGRMIDEGGMR